MSDKQASSTNKSKGKTRKKRLKPNEELNMSRQYVAGLFNEFIREKETLERVEETIKSYKVTYAKFNEYFGARADYIGDIVGSMFVEWTNAMKEEGLKAATINHHLGGMRAFMYWCMDDSRKYVDRFRIRLIKVQEELPKDYTIAFILQNMEDR